MTMENLVQVHLSRVVIQEKEEHQYIHLREKDGQRSFPIVIGFNEAAEINRKLTKDQPPRPMTHDLITRIIDACNARITRVVISDLREHTFFATLVLEGDEGEKFVDCRPSDAIALAVQARADIFVAADVFNLVAPE
jgi:bifunctional DNase/RNase